MADPTPIRLSVDPHDIRSSAIARAVRALQAGRLIVYPTDTLYGLGADPVSSDAVERLFEVKGRPAELAVPLIAADVAQVERHAGLLMPLGRRLADRFWPGPLTLVVTASVTLSRRLLGGGDSVAVRVPDHPVARTLARELGRPLTATSANRSGQPPSSNAEEAARGLGGSVEVIVDAGPTQGGEPSTIVDVRGAAPLLVRAGTIPWDRVVTLKN